MQVTRGVARRDHAFPAQTSTPALVVTSAASRPIPRTSTRWTATAITQPDQRWARCDIKIGRAAAERAGPAGGARAGRDRGDPGRRRRHGDRGRRDHLLDRRRATACCARAISTTASCRAARAARWWRSWRRRGSRFEERAFSEAEMRRGAGGVHHQRDQLREADRARSTAKQVGDGEVGPVTRQLFELFARHVQGGLRNAACRPPLPRSCSGTGTTRSSMAGRRSPRR